MPMLFDVRGAAEQLGLSERQVWYIIKAGKLRALKVGGATRIKESELRRYIDALPERQVS